MTRIKEKLAAAEKENTHLRAALAASKDPCIYCQLPAEEMAKCRSGFPGCSRADDITGCPEFGAMMNEASLREELTTAQAQIEAARNEGLQMAVHLLTSYNDTRSGCVAGMKLAVSILQEALKSTAPVRDDARDKSYSPINGVAVRIRSTGEVLTELAPKRHGDILNRMKRLGLPTNGEEVECGFTCEGSAHNFYSREAAYVIATKHDQLIAKPQIPGKLFSEDVW